MRFSATVLASAAILSTANAAYKGFNYGAFFLNQEAKKQADFEYEFNAAKQLPGTNGEFTSARLYTMIQWGTTNSVIEAIQAAINTKTSLLLGMWCSSGAESFNNEITALKAAVQQYGTAFTDLVVGISVGSEDLYRITPTGIENNSGAGAQPNELLNYIQQTRAAIQGTGLQGKPIGHVDTWTAYVNASNNAVIEALDFIGVDAYPYFQTTMANSIGNANATFYDAYRQTVAAAQGKPVWVTETGWPVSGPQQNQAVASADNARIYWEDVSCSLMQSNIHLYYYTLQDAQWGNPSPSFGIKPAGDLMQVDPLFDLSCSSSSKPMPSETPTASVTSGTETPTSSEIPTSISDIFTTPEATATPSPPLIPTELPIPTEVPLPTERPLPTGTSSSELSAPTELPPEVPVPNIPKDRLTPPFVAPNLIVPIDKSEPNKVIGNRYTAQVSSTLSTLFIFNVPPEYSGRICSVVFHLPPTFPQQYVAPYTLRSPGGIAVSRLDQPVTIKTSSNNVGKASPIGSTPSLMPGNNYNLVSAPCEVGKTLGYRIDALGGLDLDFFQMTSPAIGLFILVSG